MICKNCNKKEAIKFGKYSNGEFCSRSCANSYSTKYNRKERNKKISKSLTGKGNDDVEKICKQCENKFVVKWNKRKQICCSRRCSMLFRQNDEEYKKKISLSLKKHYENPENRKRMRDIGRKGGFGKKGYIKGIYYASSIEKDCFNYLINENTNFMTHQNIPNSTYVSDIYLVDFDLWIEIDGINREKRKEWLKENYEKWIKKLNHYKEQKLKLEIVYNLNELKTLYLKLQKKMQ